ncbi:hypothetical protein D3C76_1793840 [compost metagenome]
MAHDLFERCELRLPTQYGLGLAGIRHQPWRVSGAARGVMGDDLATGYGAGGIDHLLH